MTGLDGEQIILLLEDHHFMDTALMELTNSLLGAEKYLASTPAKNLSHYWHL